MTRHKEGNSITTSQPEPAPAHSLSRTFGRLARWVWKAVCAMVCGLILGLLGGLAFGSLWIGVACALPGAAIGWFLGKFISPVDVVAGPITGDL